MKTHISLNVSNIENSVEFYKKMLGTEPMKFITEPHNGSGSEDLSEKKSGYAKFDLDNPPLNLALNERKFESGGSLSHLGLQVASTEDVLVLRKRWEEAGLATADEDNVVCCYARQDKTWVSDPDGNSWEAFAVLENTEVHSDSTGCCDVENKTRAELPVATASCC